MKTPKSEETRARILAAALEAFHSQGFDQTTMRDIAQSAGVATGAAYYYFDSKDAIVLAFYDQARREMEAELERILADTRDLEKRLRGLIEVKLKYFEPSRALLGALAGHTDPQHPLSPFSNQTRAIREADIAFFERALAGVRIRVPDDLMAHLPRLLWLYQMGIILFWIYDRSAAQRKTRALTEKSASLIVRLLRLASLPLMRPLRRVALDVIATALE